MTEASAEESGDSEEAYSGLFGAIPYALRASRSWLFKSYVVLGGLAALMAALLMVFALVTLIAQTATIGGGSLTLSRAFYVVVGLFVVGPLLAPILFVARRHRRQGSRKRYDAGLALTGFVFLGSLYVGLLISVPPGQQETVSGVLAPTVEFLYALPQIAGVVPPVLAAVLIVVVHRLAR
jgi:hypothetical protein